MQTYQVSSRSAIKPPGFWYINIQHIRKIISTWEIYVRRKGICCQPKEMLEIYNICLLYYFKIYILNCLYNMQRQLIVMSSGLEISSKDGRKLGPCHVLQSYKSVPRHGQDQQQIVWTIIHNSYDTNSYETIFMLNILGFSWVPNGKSSLVSGATWVNDGLWVKGIS